MHVGRSLEPSWHRSSVCGGKQQVWGTCDKTAFACSSGMRLPSVLSRKFGAEGGRMCCLSSHLALVSASWQWSVGGEHVSHPDTEDRNDLGTLVTWVWVTCILLGDKHCVMDCNKMIFSLFQIWLQASHSFCWDFGKVGEYPELSGQTFA